MDDFIFFDVKGDSTLQNLNTVIETEQRINEHEYNTIEQDYIGINEPTNKKNKKKKKNSKKNKTQPTFINPTQERPIIVDDDVYIEIESDNDENDSSNNIISNNAFDILNKTQFNDYMDDELIKDYLENCKDDNNSEKIETDSDSSKINQNDVIIDEKSEQSDEEHDIEFLNSAFAKNIIKSDVGVETEPVEMEMDLIKLLENKLPSDDSSSSSENSEVEYISVKDDKKSIQKNTNSSVKNRNKKNKKNKKGKRNNKQKVNNNSKQLNMDIEVDNNVPVINIEDVVIELDKEPDLKDNQETFNIDSPSVIIE